MEHFYQIAKLKGVGVQREPDVLAHKSLILKRRFSKQWIKAFIARGFGDIQLVATSCSNYIEPWVDNTWNIVQGSALPTSDGYTCDKRSA